MSEDIRGVSKFIIDGFCEFNEVFIEFVDVEDKEWDGIEGIFNTWVDDYIKDFYYLL